MVGRSDHDQSIDLEPLAEVIRNQNRRIEELSAAAAFWQVRAQQAEDQLKQLTAGETRHDAGDDHDGDPQCPGMVATSAQ